MEKVFCLNLPVNRKWAYQTGGAVYSSPALADRVNVQTYDQDWPMFRHDARRTGFYPQGSAALLDVYVGSKMATFTC
jgi:hypothetical protein